jgi:hypothetical protein
MLGVYQSPREIETICIHEVWVKPFVALVDAANKNQARNLEKIEQG